MLELPYSRIMNAFLTGAAEPINLHQSLTGYVDGLETSHYRAILQETAGQHAQIYRLS